MALKTKFWFFQDSRDNLVKFIRSDDSSVLVKSVEGDIGVIDPSQTTWYTGDRLTGAEDNQGILQLPLVTFIAPKEKQISDALRRHARDMEAFGQRNKMFGLDEGTLYVVLTDSIRADLLSMTMAFCFTVGDLIPAFDGIELDTIFVDETPQPTPSPTHRVSRYERKWVI